MNRLFRLMAAPGLTMALGAVAAPGALAASFTINLSTVPTNSDVNWKVSEVTDGQVVVGAPVYDGDTYGEVPGFTIPFTNNDGYWTAHATFKLPSSAQSPVLVLQSVGVDDRAVVLLNGNVVTDTGTTSGGNGYMTYVDHGPNQPRTFGYRSGPQDLSIRSGFISGVNTIQVVINNTNEGVLGVPVPVEPNSPSSFGLSGAVVYSTPAP